MKRAVSNAAVAFVTIAAGAGCYEPFAPSGVPCNPSAARCPEGQSCVAGATGDFVCSGHEPGTPDAPGPGGDTAPDLCFGTGLVKNLCLSAAPTGSFTFTGTVALDTTTVGSGNCTTIVAQTGGPSICVVARETIRVDSTATVRVTGLLPLVLIATGSIDIAGTIDASGHKDGTPGPGARVVCTGQTPGQNGNNGSGNGGGGGAGGSFGGAGAGGGKGNGGPSGGTAGAAAAPTFLVGGCAGSSGGMGDGGGGNGAGGPGGGAIYAIARTAITLGGTIAASGGGGKGGTGGMFSGGGGGGGGAGGLIGLDAPTVTVTGRLYANGGGGGGGNGNQPDLNGTDGTDPAMPLTVAPGGQGGNNGGGNGGAGFAKGITPVTGSNGNNAQCGGGGGGGGAGVIRVFHTPATLGGTVSPTPT